MFKQVICRSCEGNGCVKCCHDGVVYKEIDDPTLALQDEITELKEKLKIAVDAFIDIDVLCNEASMNESLVLRVVDRALQKIESAGE